MTESNSLARVDKAPLAVGRRGVVVNSMEDLWRLAQGVVAAGFAPKGLNTPQAVLACMQMGMELGISPMASLRGIAVINGRPSVYGDLAMALIHDSGLLEYSKEWINGDGDARTAHCEMKRSGRPDPITRQFSVSDAKRAGLWLKEGPWKNYPDRMLQMRARGYASRDEFADVLQGMYFAEESQDIIESAPVDSRPRVESVLDKVRAALPNQVEKVIDPAPQVQPPSEEPQNGGPVSMTPEQPPEKEMARGSAAEHGGPVTWEQFVTMTDELAMDRKCSPSIVEKARKNALVRAGKVGKESTIEAGTLAAWWSAAQRGEGFFILLKAPVEQTFDEEPAPATEMV